MARTRTGARKPHSSPAPRKQRLTLRESVSQQASQLKVDRDAGIIYRVKILGWKSSNNRRYVPEGGARAVQRGLYEDVKVFIDHPLKPGEQRPSTSLFGKIREATVEPDGIYGNLHYLTSHEMAERVCEDVERGLGVYGLSHNADAAEWVMEGGCQVVTDLAVVHSVDLVSDAATNANLWESRTVKKTLKQILEAAAKLTADRRSALLKLSEAYGCSTMEMDDPLTMASPDAGPKDPKAILADAVAALVQSDSPEDHELAQKIMKLMKPESSPDNTPALVTEDDEDDEEKDAAKESKKAKKPTAAGLTEAKAKSLCTLAGLKPEGALLESLVGTDEEKALKLLEWAKAQSSNTGGGTKTVEDVFPKSTPAGRVQESRNGGQGAIKFEGQNAAQDRLAFLRTGRLPAAAKN